MLFRIYIYRFSRAKICLFLHKGLSRRENKLSEQNIFNFLINKKRIIIIINYLERDVEILNYKLCSFLFHSIKFHLKCFKNTNIKYLNFNYWWNKWLSLWNDSWSLIFFVLKSNLSGTIKLFSMVYIFSIFVLKFIPLYLKGFW